MNLVHKQPVYPVPYSRYPMGLGFKLFGINFGGGWLKKGLKAAVGMVGGLLKTAIPFAAPLISQGEQFLYGQIDELDDSLSIFKTLNTNELTAAEEAKLNAWLPVFESYAKALSNEVIAASKLSASSQLAGLNAVLNKIDVVQRHYQVTAEAGLSAKALEQRDILISQVLNVVYTAITACIDKLKSQGNAIQKVPVTFSASAYGFSPLFSSTKVTTVTGENFKIANGLPAPGETTPGKDGGTTLNPGGNTPVLNTGGTTTGGTPAKKDNTMLIVGGIGLAALGYMVFGGSSKPKAKATGSKPRKGKK